MSAMRRVARFAREKQLVEQALEKAMRDARCEGETLRAIAAAAGVSYETVRKIVG